MSTVTSLYDQDFYAWALKNAELLRQGQLSEIDVTNVAEELESMGRSEWYELVDRLAVLLAHLLKWQAQKERRHLYEHSWRSTIAEQRRRVARRLQKSPSLKYGIEETLAEAYGDAVVRAMRQTGLDRQAFPATCPFTLEQVLDSEFWPD